MMGALVSNELVYWLIYEEKETIYTWFQEAS